mgnify:FL=1
MKFYTPVKMIYHTTTTYRYIRVFSLFPTRLSDGSISWLEYYTQLQRKDEDIYGDIVYIDERCDLQTNERTYLARY